MRLINGKFYSNQGEPMALEFGNKEQIKLMQIAQDLKDGSALGFGVEGDKVIFGFYCPCGDNVIVEDGEHNLPKQVVCKSCGTAYMVSEKDDEAIVKTKQNKTYAN